MKTKIYLLFALLILGTFDITLAQEQAKSSEFDIFKFRNVGPTRGGRVTTVAGVASKPGTFYMGATGGGVWKSDDYGINWKNVSDGFFSTPSIGDINVVQSDPNIIYVGTGSDGMRSNVITGKGVYKSEDEGKTWKHIGLGNAGQIGAVEIHPDNPDIVYVAAIGQAFNKNKERGLYRTKDGGETWENVLFLSDSIGAVDFEFSADDPNTMFATMWRTERKPWTIISGGHQAGGLYKSTDGGDSWDKVTNGLPNGLIGKMDLGVSPADPNKVYLLVEAPKGEGGLYVSNDKGDSFELVSTNTGIQVRPFYYCNIEVNPQNANSVYVMATGYFHSTDGGKKWGRVRPPHGDNHDMWINPNDSLLFIQANDGGANVTLNGGKSWSTQRNQPTAELYQIEVDNQYPYWLYAGQQDNSTIAVPSVPPYYSPAGAQGQWMAVGGCETGPAVPNPDNSDEVFANCKGRFGVFDKKTGQERQYYVGASNMYGHNPTELKYRFQRVSPIHVSPHNSDIVYHTSQFVHKTTNKGITWETISPDLTAFREDRQVVSGGPITRDVTGEEFYSTIYAIQESKISEGEIWIGANDGPVHVTRDGGENWTNVTPSDLPSGGRIDGVEPSRHQKGKAYVTSLRYQLGDWKPYIFKTTDYGQSWKLITNGIPTNYPVRVVREDPKSEGLLYAGTEFGLFMSMDDGETWKAFNQNLPVTPITDIKVHRNDLVMSTMGRSFWILDNLSTLHQMKESKVTGTTLFKPEDTFRYRYRGTGANSTPSYPGSTVIIDYNLVEQPEGEISLEILNGNGIGIRNYASKPEEKDGNGSTSMATGFFRQGPRADLKKSVGMHRFTWDMRHDGAWDKNPSRSFQNGPMAAPGTYTARLTVGGEVFEQNFELVMDPKLEAANITIDDLMAQEALSLKIRDMATEAKRSTAKVVEKRKSIATLKEKGKAKAKVLEEDSKLAEIESALVTAEGIYMTPMIVDQIGYLGSMLNRADQKPGDDAYLRFEELRKRLDDLAAKWDFEKMKAKIDKKK